MSRSIDSPKSQGTVEVLDLAVSELTYLPTPDQRRTKAAFWALYSENPMCDPSDISVALVERLIDDKRVSRWWPVAGFKEWFRNRDEFRQRLEYMSQLALDRLEHILADPKANSSAQVSAAKLIMEVARKMPPKQAPAQIYLDEKVSQMDRRQLEDYIRKHTKQLESSSPADPQEVDYIATASGST